MTIPISERIAAIIRGRHGHAPKAGACLAHLTAAKASLDRLKSSLRALADDPKATTELKDLAGSQLVDDMRERLEDALSLQHRLHARFSRATINLGVSGQARVGKSQLLQTISGLGDDELPTGTGTPVTAVRSRIINSSQSVACLSMHDWFSFRDEVIKRYHEELGLHGLPETIDQFGNWPYPEPLPDAENERNVMLGRLRMMQETLATYRDYLTGDDLTIKDLTALRQWVAYPKDETEARYLAVKDARIDCPFPHADLTGVGLIDLPGLGEIAAKAEKHHLAGLREEVDYVLFVKRANEGMAYWKREDANARKLIDEARKPIERASDFVGIVSNEGGLKQETLDRMLADISRKANSGLGEHPLKLYRCNATNHIDVVENLVAPVLAHLAERLPVMDEELSAFVAKEVDDATTWVISRLQFFQTSISRALPDLPGTYETLDEVREKISGDLAQHLALIVQERKKAVHKNREDPAFSVAIQEAHKDIERWARDGGLGRGKEGWTKSALSIVARDKATGPLAVNELNRIRVHIGECFCRLDAHLNIRIEELVEQVGDVFVSNCGELLKHTRGRRSLELLADAFLHAEEPCPNMARAVNDLLGLRVNYRSHFHPRVRKALDVLENQYEDSETGEKKVTVETQDPTDAGVDRVLRDLIDLAVHGSHQVRQQLLGEEETIGAILFAAVEQFADSLIRSGTSKREFGRFCSCYRRDLFPGIFDATESQSSQVRSVKEAFSEARACLTFFKEANNV